ncbi:MAG: DNA/RNA non-specific endonuclease, partial [Bacteroidetes bacterium]
MLSKVGIFSLILGGLFFLFQKFSNPSPLPDEPVTADVPNLESANENEIFYLPTSTTGKIIKHKYYALSWDEKHELAEWVAYELTRDRLKSHWVERTNDFRPDPDIPTKSAEPADYKRSG